MFNEHLKSPPVKIITSQEANYMLSQWHYLGPLDGIIVAHGNGEGCCVYANPRSRELHRVNNNKGLRTIELARMVGMPDHKWAMSSLMSQSLKLLVGYDIVVTYADPNAGHNGAVYKACNWVFNGYGDSGKGIYINGKLEHRRSLYSRYGTSSVPQLAKICNDIRVEDLPDKPRFIFYLKNKAKQLRLDLPLQYP